jgi:hypothetical protein
MSPVYALVVWLAAFPGGCVSSGARIDDPTTLTAHANTAETMPDPDLPPDRNDDSAERDFVRRPSDPAFRLTVFHIQVPRDRAAGVHRVWDQLREDFVSTDQQLSLRLNGIRVGIGHSGWWQPIKHAFDEVTGNIVTMPQPVRMPAGFPLALELDNEPADQTLFFVGRDGVLSGDTWSESRNVLRVTIAADPRHPDRARIVVIPEVRRMDKGMRLVRTAAGMWQVPKMHARAFDAAGFDAVLAAGEFLLIGPSAGDLAYGLIGNAFLSREVEGTRYDSYVILRPEHDVN